MNLSRPSFSTSIKHVIGNPLLRVSYFNLKSGPPSTAVYIDNFESLCVSIEFNWLKSNKCGKWKQPNAVIFFYYYYYFFCSYKHCSPPTPSYQNLSLFLLLFPIDDGSEPSSGRDTPASSSSRQGVGDRIEEKGKKDKKKKAKTKKKEKNKGKGKEKEKKKAEEPEETEKKSKKIGFGLLR